MTGLFLQWLYFDAPNTYWEYRKQLSQAMYSFFSISLLSKTLFDPWRHDEVDTSRLAVKDRFQALGQNLISRLIGFMLRSWAILTGYLMMGVIYIGTALFVLAWYLMPILLLLSIFYGLRLIIGF